LTPATSGESTPARRSPSVAAILSFVWPGLGHWYMRRERAARLFAMPYIAVLLLVGLQATSGLSGLAALLISPSSALTIAILIALLGIWREVAVIDSAIAIRPHGAWRGGRSLIVLGLVTSIIVGTHVWAASVAWAFYDAGSRIFVGAEGPDAFAAVRTTSAASGMSADPNDVFLVPPFVTPSASTDRINFLLTGVDSAEERSHAVTDTLIVASINPTTRAVALISFPRDISDFPLVDGGTYHGKINSFMTDAANHPGTYKDKPLVELARELGYLVGAPIHYYAVDLAGFRRLIDAAGGVTITNELAIDDPSYDWFDGRHGFRLSAGRHALDGEDALAFVRSRSTPADDFNRARRQQEVLLALLEKITNPSMLPRIQQLIGVAGDTVRTNFPSDRLSDVLALAGGIDASTVSQVVLGPPYSVLVPGSQAAGTYSLHLDLHKVAALSIKVFGSESRYPQP
jgi:LCP family protein required for cell wall assembly